MIQDVRIGKEIVPLSRSASVIALKMRISRDALGGLLAQSPHITSRKGNLTCISVMDVRSVADGKERLRPTRRFFRGQIIELTLSEKENNGELQLQQLIDDVLFVLPGDARKPPFLGQPLRYKVERVAVSRRQGRNLVVFVGFHSLRRATRAQIEEATLGS